METNFFRAIADLNISGDLKLIIGKGANGEMLISLLLVNEKVGDDARKIIPPIVFKGTPQEIDEAFFDRVTQPLQNTDGLLTNMEQYLKQVEQAKAQSKMEQDKDSKERKEKDERKKKYEGMMKKVDEAEEAKKYQEAIAHMPKAEQFPEQAEDIRKRLDSLRQKNGQLTFI